MKAKSIPGPQEGAGPGGDPISEGRSHRGADYDIGVSPPCPGALGEQLKL